METTANYSLDSDSDDVLHYLAIARQHHSQAAIAKFLKVDKRTIRRWETRETEPKPYIAPALRQLILAPIH